MSGKERFSSDRVRRQLSPRRVPQLNLGLIAMLSLAALGLAGALMFPTFTPPAGLFM
jgi:hypothetical protein